MLARTIILGMAISFCSLSVPCAANSSKQFNILYGGNDGICRAFKDVYTEANNENVAGMDSWVWEEKYNDIYRSHGLVLPDPIKDSLHYFHERGGPWDYFYASYKLVLDKRVGAQVVTIEDSEWKSHGSFASDVYVLKPRHDYSNPGSLDEADVSIGIQFSDRVDDEYAGPRLPYLFKKDNVYRRFSFIFNSSIIPLDVGLHNVSPVIQRLYNFRGVNIFSARNEMASLIYQVVDGGRIKDICYISSSTVVAPHDGEK